MVRRICHRSNISFRHQAGRRTVRYTGYPVVPDNGLTTYHPSQFLEGRCHAWPGIAPNSQHDHHSPLSSVTSINAYIFTHITGKQCNFQWLTGSERRCYGPEIIRVTVTGRMKSNSTGARALYCLVSEDYITLRVRWDFPGPQEQLQLDALLTPLISHSYGCQLDSNRGSPTPNLWVMMLN